MSRYRVDVPTTCIQSYEVEAENEEQAKEKVLEGEAEMTTVEYDGWGNIEMDSNNFIVEEIK